MTATTGTSIRNPEPKLLVVEDDVGLRPLLSSMVRKINPEAKIDWAFSAEEALNWLRNSKSRNSYDVVLADVLLGDGATGLEFAETCFDTKVPGKFFLMTGLQSVESLETRLPVLHKPFRFSTFQKLIGPSLQHRPVKRREAAIQPSTFNSVDLEVFKWFLIFFACVAMMFGAYISDGPLPTLYDAAPEAPLFHAFADPELKSAVQSLLEGGLTPLIHNPVKWKKLEVASRMEVKALF